MATQLPTKASVPVPERFSTEVLRDDLLDGIACSASLCPLVRSISRTLREMGVKFTTVSVLPRDVEIYIDWDTSVQRYWYDAESFVRDIDAGRHVEPRTVTLVKMP